MWDVFPSPRFQVQLVIVPSVSVDVSVNWMVSVVVGVCGVWVKFAVGGILKIVMICVCVVVALSLSVIVSVIV